MFGSLFVLVTDVVKIVAAPVEVAATLVSVPVKVLADAAQEVVNAVKD